MKKNEKTQKPTGFFNVGFFEKTNWANQIGPNQAHPASDVTLVEVAEELIAVSYCPPFI